MPHFPGIRNPTGKTPSFLQERLVVFLCKRFLLFASNRFRDPDALTLVSECEIATLSFPTILISHFPLLALPGVPYYFALNCMIKSTKPVNKRGRVSDPCMLG